MNAKSIFNQALRIDDPDERRVWLDRTCADSPQLRRKVEVLLQAHNEAGSYLEKPLIATVVQSSPTERPGDTIGPYKLREQIGEGGFGVVYVAEQEQPVSRKVALKIIKPGMDTREVIARFEAERQALALMDHPNIAKVFDAGTTETGRPYFVMELVPGLPITQFCDEHKLTNHERLGLFVEVCRAVQHAHQKGIIHRDLKPSNILVALDGDRPIPKVIDFGISKALSQKLTDKTVYTAYGQMVGTPLYMAPEQAALSLHDVDTRSDVYSLGVLLYELLTGTTPFDAEALKQAGFDEMRRIIREDEPPRPSDRISTLNAQLISTACDRRKTDRRTLDQSLRGELDWIVIKALEKDRNRRYESASTFAADVQRYLHDEPVQACPPSTVYRLRKFVHRNRARLVTAAAVCGALLVAIASLSWAIHDRSARQQQEARAQLARQERVEGKVDGILDEIHRLMEEQEWAEALSAAQRAETLLADIDATPATQDRLQGALDDLRLVQQLEEIRLFKITWVGTGFNHAAADRAYADAFREHGIDFENSSPEQVVFMLRPHKAIAVPLAVALDEWVDSKRNAGVSDESNWKRLVAVAQLLDPDPHRSHFRSLWGHPFTPESTSELADLARDERLVEQPAATLVLLAKTLNRGGLRPEALAVLRNAQQRHPADFWINFELAADLYEDEDDENAIRFYSVALGLRPENTAAWNNLGNALKRQGKLDEAVNAYQTAIQFDPKHVPAHCNLGSTLGEQGMFDEALAELRTSAELDPQGPAPRFNLALVLKSQNRLDEAIKELQTAIELDPAIPDAHFTLGLLLDRQNRSEEALIVVRQAVELAPDDIGAHYLLGTTLAKLQQWDEAIKEFGAVIERDPESADPHVSLGLCYRDLNRWEDAIKEWQTAIEIDPELTRAKLFLGRALLDRGQPEEALKEFRRAAEIAPDDIEAHYGLGVALDRLDRRDEAIEEFRRALEIDPQNVIVRINLGYQLNLQERLEEAINEYRRAVEIDSENVNAYLGLGGALKRHGETVDAINEFRRVIQIDPTDWRPYFNLGTIYQENSDPDRAIENYRRALELGRDWSAATLIWHELGGAYRDKGNANEAMACFRKAIETGRCEPSYIELARQQDAREAVATLREGLRVHSNSAGTRNELAWILAMTEDPAVRDPQEALVQARQAVEIDPASAAYWNTLSVAAFRAGEWQESLTARQAKNERSPVDTEDRLFLAMTHWRLGHQAEARDWLTSAAAELDANAESSPRLLALREEAESLLGSQEDVIREPD